MLPCRQEGGPGNDLPEAVGSLPGPLPVRPGNGLAGLEDAGLDGGKSCGRGALGTACAVVDGRRSGVPGMEGLDP